MSSKCNLLGFKGHWLLRRSQKNLSPACNIFPPQSDYSNRGEVKAYAKATWGAPMNLNPRVITSKGSGQALIIKMGIEQFIEENSDSLTGILRSYVKAAGLDEGDSLSDVTAELFNEMTVEAMKSVARFDPELQPARAWLLKIAANLVKRRLRGKKRQRKGEVRVRDRRMGTDGAAPGSYTAEAQSDAEFFDHLVGLIMDGDISLSSRSSWASVVISPGLHETLEGDEQAERLLDLIPERHHEVLRLAVINELSGERLANELGVGAGTARVRLHRALNSLRSALEKMGNYKG